MLTGSHIGRAVEAGEIGIAPYDPACLGTHSYRLHLGRTILRQREGGVIDLSDLPPGDDYEKLEIGDEGYVLEPGGMICWQTQEQITMPSHLAGVIDGVSLLAQYGIMPVSGSREVSPGSQGPLILEIVNLGNRACRLRPGLAIAKLLFKRVADEGNYVERKDPPPDQPASRGSLHGRGAHSL